MSWKLHHIPLLAALALLCLCASVTAQTTGQTAGHAVEPAGAAGTIDWTAMRARATGIGIAPANVADPARANAMAERAAILDARRNLLEVIGAVRIDSRTTVRDFITASDEVRTEVRGMLRGSQVERTGRRSDGSWTAMVSVALTGDLSRSVLSAAAPSKSTVAPPAPVRRPQSLDPTVSNLRQQVARQQQRIANLEQHLGALLRRNNKQAAQRGTLSRQMDETGAGQTPQPTPAPQQDEQLLRQLADLRAMQQQLNRRLDRMEREAIEPSAAPQPVAETAPMSPTPTAPPVPGNAPALPTVPAITPEQAAARGYTGVVLDTRDIGFAPSLRPSVLGPDGGVVYPPAVAQAAVASRGAVRYYRDLGQAQRSERAGANPLTIKATGLSASGDPQLAPQDAALLRALSAAEGNPLDNLDFVMVF